MASGGRREEESVPVWLLICFACALVFIRLTRPREYRPLRWFRILASVGVVAWILHRWSMPVDAGYLPAIFAYTTLAILWTSPVAHFFTDSSSPYWEPIVEKHEDQKGKTDDPEELFHNAAAHLATGDPRTALGLLRPFLKSHPSHPEALLLMAEALMELGDPDTAIEILLILKKRPQNAPDILRVAGVRISECAQMQLKRNQEILKSLAEKRAKSSRDHGPKKAA